jgi:hypothetical protein
MDNPTILSIELIGRNEPAQQTDGRNSATAANYNTTIQQETNDNNNNTITSTRIRIIVTIPLLVDGPQANVAADVLLTQLDQYPDAIVDSVAMRQLQFTRDGVDGLKLFLTIHASTIQQVTLADLTTAATTTTTTIQPVEDSNNDSTMNSDSQQQQQQENDVVALIAIAESFAESELISLDLSHNHIDASVWKHWSAQCGHTLRRLTLDRVYLDKDSLQELEKHISLQALDEISIVWMHALEASGVATADRILANCQRLTKVKLAYKHQVGKAKLMWTGLQTLVRQGGCQLATLALEGARCTDPELLVLLDILTNSPTLSVLQLRNLNLTDGQMLQICASLNESRPLLTRLDLSYNALKEGSVKGICDLYERNATILDSVQVLSLNNNHIGPEGFDTLLQCATVKCRFPRADINIHGNPIAADKWAFGLAVAKYKMQSELTLVRKERDSLLIDLAKLSEQNRSNRSIGSDQNRSSRSIGGVDSQVLLLENRQLKEDRDTLLRAFSIAAASQSVEQNRQVLDRISRLEDMFLSLPADTRQTSDGSNTARGMTTTLPPTPTQSRRGSLLDTMLSPMTPRNTTTDSSSRRPRVHGPSRSSESGTVRRPVLIKTLSSNCVDRMRHVRHGSASFLNSSSDVEGDVVDGPEVLTSCSGHQSPRPSLAKRSALSARDVFSTNAAQRLQLHTSHDIGSGGGDYMQQGRFIEEASDEIAQRVLDRLK